MIGCTAIFVGGSWWLVAERFSAFYRQWPYRSSEQQARAIRTTSKLLIVIGLALLVRALARL